MLHTRTFILAAILTLGTATAHGVAAKSLGATTLGSHTGTLVQGRAISQIASDASSTLPEGDATAPGDSDSAELHVPGTYSSIDQAIGATRSGDRIVVDAGTYPVGATISTDITIEGHGEQTVLVAAEAGTPHFTIAEGGVLRLNDLDVEGSARAEASVVGLGGSVFTQRVNVRRGYSGVYGTFQELNMRQGSVSHTDWTGISVSKTPTLILSELIISYAHNAGVYIDESGTNEGGYTTVTATIDHCQIIWTLGPGVYFRGPYSHLYITHSTIKYTTIAGVFLYNPGTVDMIDDDISWSVADDQDSWGDGVVVFTLAPQCFGTVAISNSLIHKNARAGLSNWSSCVLLANDDFYNNKIHLNGETNPGSGPFTFDGSKNNSCIPDSPCQVLSASLTPPEPIKPTK